MTNPKFRYNERAWGIELISYINKTYEVKNDSIVRSASGELSLDIPKGNTCFPDVIIFGDKTKGKVLQGWELKMPDTPIEDKTNIENAEKKARVLALNSFLVWNVEKADLYVKNNDTFVFLYRLYTCPIKLTREDVQKDSSIWEKATDSIISQLNTYFSEGILKTTNPEEVFSDNGVIFRLLSYQSAVAEYLKKCRLHDKIFDAKVNLWWITNKKSYPGHQNAETPLAAFILFHWLNKFLILNVLQAYHTTGGKSHFPLKSTISIQDAIKQFRIIQDQIKGWEFLGSDEYDSFLPQDVWNDLVSLFNGLSGFPFASISSEVAKDIIQSTILLSIQHTAGLFATPANLADLLIRLTVNVKDGFVMDPFCGTGTIARFILGIKCEDYHISGNDAVIQTFASDKFSFPIMIAQLALAMQYTDINKPLNVFLHDAFSLSVGEIISLSNDTKISTVLPKLDAIVSNVPFVRSELIKELNENVFTKIQEFYKQYNICDNNQLTQKSDLALYIPFVLYPLLKEKGNLGIIITNSWLTSDSGLNFRQLLIQFYDIEYIVISSKGRWFNDTSVVATILCCKKKRKPLLPQDNEKIHFCTTNLFLSEWDASNLSDSIITQEYKQDSVQINDYSIGELKQLSSFGIGWNFCFTDAHWFVELTQTSKVSLINTIFHVSRGERRGWDPLFYPSDDDVKKNKIEKEFLIPMLKTTNGIAPRYEIQPDAIGFCCNESIDYLENNNKTGALQWIKKFEHSTNNANPPKLLIDALKRPNQKWYEMDAKETLSFVINVNPDKTLYFSRLTKPSLINQRLICLSINTNDYDQDFLFALLNSSLVLFQLEALGGGMGDGALNLNATKLKLLHIPNPACYSLTDQKQICEHFSVLFNRKIHPITEELKLQDRQDFDSSVLTPLGISNYQNRIYRSLIDLYSIRMTSKDSML